MKKILLTLIASASVLSGMSVAHAEGAYAGVGVTASRYKFDVPGASDSSTEAAAKVFAGYDIDKTWAVEGGYTNFGSKDHSFVQNGNAGQINTDSHAFYVAGKATMPVNDQVGVFGKLGVARTHDSISGTGAAAGLGGDPSKTGLYASVGAQYAINKNVALTAEVEHMGHSAEVGRKSTALSLGARYSF